MTAPPTTRRWLAWLAGPQLTDATTGHCLSWWSEAGTGYPYPEVSGLLLSLLNTAGMHPSRARLLQQGLARHPGGGSSVGRHGVPHTFDLAMAVRGLLDSVDGSTPPDRRLRGWMDLLLELVQAQQATGTPAPLTPATHWSLSFGAHQMKAASVLARCARAWDRDGDTARAERSILAIRRQQERTCRLQQPTGRFTVHAMSTSTYLHSHCYATEGLLLTGSCTDTARSEEIAAAAGWLASVQHENGGYSAWHDGKDPAGPQRTDATAQAVRIFRLVDPTRFEGNIVRGTAFLLENAHCDGGLRYEPRSPHINSWATIFAVQAVAAPGEPGELSRPEDLV